MDIYKESDWDKVPISKEGYGEDRLTCLKNMLQEFALLRQCAIDFTRRPTMGSAANLSITSVILIDYINAFCKAVLEAKNIDYEEPWYDEYDDE